MAYFSLEKLRKIVTSPIWDGWLTIQGYPKLFKLKISADNDCRYIKRRSMNEIHALTVLSKNVE
jgi:hypothetical protein